MSEKMHYLAFTLNTSVGAIHLGAKHGEVALRKKCLWRPPAELSAGVAKPAAIAVQIADARCPFRNLALEMAF